MDQEERARERTASDPDATESSPPTEGMGTTVDLGTTALTEPLAPDFGRYETLQEIGRGGMGVVYRAFDRGLSRWVALKILGRGEVSDRFALEARVTGRLEHPNVVPVHDLGGSPDGRPYYAMKLVLGESLEEILLRLRDRRAETEAAYPLPRLLRFFLKVCEGVAYAHSKGILHRDLKPSNVMIGSHGEVLVMDWGLAKVFRGAAEPIDRPPGREGVLAPSSPAVTMDGQVFGTPQFMPPEQARGEHSRMDERSDVYALGAILYQILTLETPYIARESMLVLEAVRRGDLVPPSRRARARGREVPRELEAVVLKAMERRPEDRYPDVGALQREIEAYLDGRVLAAPRYSRWERTRKWVTRNPWKGAAMGVGVMGFLASGTLGVGWQVDRNRALTEEAERLAEEARGREEKLEEARTLAAARVPLERGRRFLEQMAIRLTDPECHREEVNGIGESALAEFERAISIHPRLPEAYLGVGRVLVRLGKLEESLASIDRAVTEDPDYAAAYLDRVRILLTLYETRWPHREQDEASDLPEARRFRARIESDLEAIERLSLVAGIEEEVVLFAHGLLAFLREDFRAAGELLGQYLKTAPAEVDARLYLAHALLHLGDSCAALDEVNQGIRCHAKHPRALSLRSLIHSARGERDLAIEDLNAALEIEADHVPTRIAAASRHRDRAGSRLERQEIDLALSDFGEAIRHLEHARDLDAAHPWIAPELANLYSSRASIHLARGSLLLALAGYEEAARLQPGFAPYHSMKGNVRMRVHDLTGARESLDRALELDPSLPEAYADRSAVRRLAGDRPGAISDLEEALRRAPADWTHREECEAQLAKLRTPPEDGR